MSWLKRRPRPTMVWREVSAREVPFRDLPNGVRLIEHHGSGGWQVRYDLLTGPRDFDEHWRIRVYRRAWDYGQRHPHLDGTEYPSRVAATEAMYNAEILFALVREDRWPS